MNFPPWQFSTPSNMFSSMQQKMPFSSNVSSYFRRPSKVVKTSSRNNSPRTSSRRRMTTTGHIPPTRTRSVVDHQRASMPHLLDQQTMNSRPISWHPNMLDEMSQFQFTTQGFGDSFMTTPYSSSDMNGLVTPMSYPVIDEPQIQELITPLEGLSADEPESVYGYGQDFSMTQYWLSDQAKDASIDFDPSMGPVTDYPHQWYSTTNQYPMPNVPTAPTSPSFLPLGDYGHFIDAAVAEPVEAAEELVGMGLYDSPAEVQSSSLLFGNINSGAPRRSLKLEDSFEPSSTEEDDDDDEEEDAVASEEDDINEPGVSPTTILPYNEPQALPVMDNSYIIEQWHVPTQNTYGWI